MITKLEELRKLAEASLNEPAPYVRAEAQRMFRASTNPQTILAMCDMMQQMAQNLDYFGDKYGFSSVALAAFDKWNNELKG